ncbi:protein SEED AND ROOT HAIR PROTECTIVE PROTEIN-like [Corylus avellana]|uniref:protein SEED AND ROOT HAIR PROTECTIVE PROTEIN-like n=1 Tax=Corylus avellana TaxID=13451 RepID=UPI00286A102F|nr:protein SEED AND ROOT HAIR PROTECTIVE PROTEIN-like [Corylus avellana]
MALNRFFYAASFLLFTLVIIASASDEKKIAAGNKENLLSTIIGIQGLVYCKSGPKFIPLEGAVTRITCQAVDENGFETAPFSFLSDACDAKGYFFATLSGAEVEDNRKLTECRAFLELSPSETCVVPTDVNKGISGALLGSYRLLNDKKMKLYTVGPFFFTS